MKRLIALTTLLLLLCGAASCGKAQVPPLAPTAQATGISAAAATTAMETTLVSNQGRPVAATTALTTASPAQRTTSTAASRPANATTTAAGPTSRATVKVSIPEGFSFWQIAQRLETNGVCGAREFFNAAQSYQVQSFAIGAGSDVAFRMEGYLFPDTYEFYQPDEPTAVLRKMLNTYAAKSGMPSYETLVLASIIEGESRSDTHMAMVSSVFHNRLAQGMRLQSDVTIHYVERQIKPCPLLQNTAQYAARYNTYKCAALPAGPICNPGLRAIQAAQTPSQSDYLYFFFGGDNTNHYSRTYEEHRAAVAQYGLG
jgi:UPF0755 protein